MNKEIKPKIEAIYQLSTMQNALLFHHLAEKDDQGFLNVQFIIEGDLDIDLLKESWNLAVERHPVLRTLVHWEKIMSPIQVIVPNSKMNWNILDWSNSTTSDQFKKLNELKENNKQNGIDFQKNPLSKISLIKTKSDSYYFVWPCHHLLLDGWSSSIIIKDVFTFYETLYTNKKPELDNIPSYKSYLNWLKKINTNDAKEFWANTFKGFNQPFLFNKNQLKTKTLVQNNIELSKEISLKAQEIAKTYRITLNTLFQALWSIIISKYSNSYDITYGNTVSGRSGDFPNIELIAGMFSNVIPVRTKLDFNLNIIDWLKSIQSQQIEARKFEHITINEINEWIDTSSNRLFDSLFIFENFPWDNITAGNIKVHSSNSGITSTYPLTLTIKPSESISIHLLSDASIFSQEAIHWILNRFEETVTILSTKKDISFKTLYESITSTNFKIPTQPSIIKKKTNVIDTPNNKTEFELLKIWKALLNNDNIDLTDNFFEIGGNSILSIQIISKARELDIIISPNELFENQSIKELAHFIENRQTKTLKKNSFNHLIEVKNSGKLPPLFCIHGGGSHFFFYNALSTHINPNRPLYAIQASELKDNLILHESINHMANDFVKEIKAVSPNGPYHIMGYCYSTAVALEICRIFKQDNQSVNLIIADTIAINENLYAPSRTKKRVKGFFKRLTKNPFNAVYRFTKARIESSVLPFIIKIFGSRIKKNVQILRDNLASNYLKYDWIPYNIFISLIITKKTDPTFNPEIIESWNNISEKKEVNIIHIKGNHSELFLEPTVKNTAKELEKCMDFFENKKNTLNETS